jgi:dTDP-glucose 4,6-dehydratase
VDSAQVRAPGWAARVKLEQGLAQTVAWYRENQAWRRKIKDGSYREHYRQMHANR